MLDNLKYEYKEYKIIKYNFKKDLKELRLSFLYSKCLKN